MPRRPSLLQRVWRKLRPATPQPPAPKPAAAPPPKRASSLEPLEGRIAPAALLNPTTLIYKDFDGDIVTVKFSKTLFNSGPANDPLAAANQVFKFDTGDVSAGPFDAATAPAQQLQLLDLVTNTSIRSLAGGTGLTITAEQSGTGDGFADLGYLKAATTTSGILLGAVSIEGDLGQFDAGSSAAKTAVASLKVQSLGAKGLTTQAGTGASLESNFTGALGSLTVLGDVKDASVVVVNSSVAFGSIGKLTIGGSLIGTATEAEASDFTGSIRAAGTIGAVKIGTTAAQGIVGGGGEFSGAINAQNGIASVSISGSITGGAGTNSGSIVTAGALGATSIKGDLLGGGGFTSGLIEGFSVASVTIGGDVLAGSGGGSALIGSVSTMGAVKIGGDLGEGLVTAGPGSGGINVGGKITSVTIEGALRGGADVLTGFISSGGDLGALKLGSIIGGDGRSAGSVFAGGKIASITVLGDVLGGGGLNAGSIFAGFDGAVAGDIGAIKIGGKLVGGTEDSSGTISATGKIASVTIGPAKAVDQVLLKGGGGDFSGTILGRGVGTVKIMGHVEGGDGNFSGALVSRDLLNPAGDRAGDLGAVTIAGDLRGGTGHDSGLIHADGELKSATVENLLGHDGDRSGAIRAGQGTLVPGDTGAITIKGVLSGTGTGEQAAGIVAEGTIKSVTVAGNALGGTIRAGDNLAALTFKMNVDGTLVTARGQAEQNATADLAIGKITVGGNVSNAQFLAGYDTALLASNTDAQIGAVKVAGNWSASDLVAGVLDAGAAGFGVGDEAIGGFDNAQIVSSIASIVIGGSVSGTPMVAGDSFAFTAQKIGAFKSAAGVAALNKLADGQEIALEPGEVFIREIPLP